MDETSYRSDDAQVVHRKNRLRDSVFSLIRGMGSGDPGGYRYGTALVGTGRVTGRMVMTAAAARFGVILAPFL
ncbi:MAG: hypothetical protein IPM23_22050 [Candidatus Melainabacteria bacterium]|nr:hypothetical protein [Candidatus Melainabacteria bacterium]